MEVGRVIAVAVPLCLLAGVAIYLLYPRKPKQMEFLLTFANRRLRVYHGSDPPPCNLLIIENDASLSCSSGISQRLASTAGDSLKKECEYWVKKYGNPLPGEKATTKGGKLPVATVFHVVPNEEQDVQFLRDLFRECLREAAGIATQVAMSLLCLQSHPVEEYSRVLAEECRALLTDKAFLRLEELTIWCTEEAHFAAISRAFN